MCGIYGVVRPDGAPIEAHELTPMGACLEHRGPDASGTWLDGGIGLGHQRLAIIDLSPAANQPMLDASGELAIVFNGEIYNFIEQRERLEARGVRFTTQSDTEVILALYRERGLDCLAELRGMFAFALYDRPKRRLLLARDRAGQKPLFYTRDGGAFRFASEPKALFASGAVRPRPRRTSSCSPRTPRAWRTRCWRRWRAAYRWSLRASVPRPRWSPTANRGCSSTRAMSRGWPGRSIG